MKGRCAIGVCRVLMLLGSAMWVSSCATNQPVKAPEALLPPANQIMVTELLASGTQHYVCQPATSGGTQWVSAGSEADLFDDGGNLVAHQTKGPSWIMADGSRIEGTLSASAPAPKQGDLPWQLLTAHDASGAGKFAHVQWIQQVSTHGGLNPEGTACIAGKVSRVPYTATYRFFSPKP